MRTLVLPTVLLAGAVLLGAGCDTVSDTVDGAACAASGYADEGEVSAMVAGARYATPCVRVQTAAGRLTVASIDRVVSDGDQRLLTVTAPAEVGLYGIGPTAAVASYTRRTSDAGTQVDQIFGAVSGSVTVTAVSDGAAEGTFSFTGFSPSGDEVEVAGGRFDVTF